MHLLLLLTQSKEWLIKKDPMEGDFSFPSGHTSAAFTGAAFMDYKYGLKYGLPAYILASFVGWSEYMQKNMIILMFLVAL